MYQVIPRRCHSNDKDFWLGIWQENFPNAQVRFRLTANGAIVHDVALPKAKWAKRGTPPKKRVWWTWQAVFGLQPGTEYIGELLVGGAVQARGIAKTLPNSLPVSGGTSRPFNVFIGSCYFLQNDLNRLVPQAYMELWNHPDLRPDIKFLCGDQIYFDNLPEDFVDLSLNVKDPWTWIKRRLTNKYRYTWHALDPLLSHGSTYFLTDDHEYFNDYPDRGTAPWVFVHPRGDFLQKRAEAFANDFQSAGIAEGTGIGNDLKFMVLDTRRYRSMNNRTFAQQKDVNATIKWLQNLRVPGVLVLSSPIFVPKTENSSFDFGLDALAEICKKRGIPQSIKVITDHNLPFFDAQFKPLAHALLEAQADVVVVAGDPHFSRVAYCDVPAHAANNNRPHKIIEVISSAMATVTRAEGIPDRGPDYFPMPGQAHGSIPSSKVQYLNFSSTITPSSKAAKDNFVTLSFTKPSIFTHDVEMEVFSWQCKLRQAGSQPPVPVDFHRVFQLHGPGYPPRPVGGLTINP